MDETDFEESKKIGIGNVVKASAPRNYKFLKKAFALLNIGFENQDRHDKFEVYRKIITIKAGYYDLAPTKDGEPYYLPKSLSYENMSSVDFEKWFTDTLDVISKEISLSSQDIVSELQGFY